jgi:alkanesulfonate monooxygenase SsuD/methylene tetrahydromethanopterin reductase-like flavin-dependent oxidoreductase (luciferase family)
VPPPAPPPPIAAAHPHTIKARTEATNPPEPNFCNYKDVSISPRPWQQPDPPVWVPFTGSKETIEWAGKNNLSAVIHPLHPGLTEDIVAHFAKSLAKHGHRITPQHLCVVADAYVASSRAEAIEEYAPSYLYFNQTL